ncbi:MAG: NAD-dependent epimerase/dehydratase family protein [Pseudomonadota bacterium]
MSIAITGATGRLGRAVMALLVKTGAPVHVLTRHLARATELFGDVAQIHEWHPLSSAPPASALRDADVVIHLAGEPVAGRWTVSRLDRIRRSRIVSSERLVSALKERPVRLIGASSYGIYGGRAGVTYSEETPLEAPETPVQTLVQDWERAVLSARRNRSSVAVVRYGMLCGTAARDQRALFPHGLAAQCVRGFGLQMGEGQQVVPVVDIEDAARLTVWLASAPEIEGAVNAVAPTLLTLGDVGEAIATRCGRGPRLAIPNWIARPWLGPSAPFTLGSFDIQPKRALNCGFQFLRPDGRDVIACALASHAGVANARTDEPALGERTTSGDGTTGATLPVEPRPSLIERLKNQ